MPRKPRIHIPGGYYHIILRGNSRQPVFFDAADRHAWEERLAAGLERYQHRIHAYCWMTNHVHMLMEVGVEPVARFITYLASNYSRWSNLKMQRSGHLFERRYRATLVDKDSYLKELVRYIHMNPLRANLVSKLGEYPWSSHHAYAGKAAPGWLTLGAIQSVFGETNDSAQRCYAQFMGEQQPEATIKLIRAGNEQEPRMLGSDDWRSAVLQESQNPAIKPSVEQFVHQYCLDHNVNEGLVRSTSRNRSLTCIRAELTLRAVELHVASVGELARYLGRSQPALSRAINRLRQSRNKL